VAEARVTAFICANCARQGAGSPASHSRPTTPDFRWAHIAREVIVPCTGRLQPEHLLRPFEAGTDLVCVIACEEDNCHYVEGSCRANRRCTYVIGLLEEIGLGPDRLMLFHLPGSARQDLAGQGTVPGVSEQEIGRQVDAIVAAVVERLESLQPNPMHPSRAIETVEVAEVEEAEENED
jgi:coenzyme F420-reducing hydrogenase delta subunit